MISITCPLVAVLVKTSSFTLPLSVSCFNLLVLGTRKESSCLKRTNVLFNVRFLGLVDIIEKIITSLDFSDLQQTWHECAKCLKRQQRKSHIAMYRTRGRPLLKCLKRKVWKLYWVSHSIINPEPCSALLISTLTRTWNKGYESHWCNNYFKRPCCGVDLMASGS